jgi:DNA polymerase III subunit gamma/tau
VTGQASRLSLYRTWRPQRFSDIVGQEAIVQTLRNAVIANEVAHAYLFSGERGIGKTSAARILARAVNCLSPSDGEPCNVCANCVAIQGNRTLDIVEIDGASNRGIDHIRQLRDEVNFSPTDLKLKVYIIDEVHMLTNEAFNALLKTLEEPPAHAMFVFATTEPHKVPRTIISRCQAFDFRGISAEKIAGHLAVVAQSLHLEPSPDALSLIAHRANGGMRDALVMLEQLASYGGKTLSTETVLDMLGLADRSVHEGFLRAIETRDQVAVMDIIDQLVERGKDLEIFLADVMSVLRDRLRQPSDTKQQDIRISQGILDVKASLFRSLDRRIRLEVGVLALMESALGEPRHEDAPRRVEPQVAAPSRSAKASTDSAGPPRGKAARPSHPAPLPSDTQQAPAGKDLPPAANLLSPERKTQWEDMLQEIQLDRIAIAAFLIEGWPSVEGDKLLVSFHPDHSFHKASLEMRDNLQYLAGAVRRHFGPSVHVEIRTDNSVSRKPLPHEVLMEKARMVCEAVDGKVVKEEW